MPAPSFRDAVNTAGFVANPVGYMLFNGGAIPNVFGGDTIQGRVGSMASRVGSWIQGTFSGNRQTTPTQQRTPSGRPSISNIASGNINGMYQANRQIAQAGGLSARNAINNRYADNRQTFRDINTPRGAASRNGNNGRLLGGGVIGSAWRQSGITFNDRQQTE